MSETTAAGRTDAGDHVAASPVYPIGSRINEAGHLEIGGCDVVAIAREHGTPAYLYAPADIRARARSYIEAFADERAAFTAFAADFPDTTFAVVDSVVEADNVASLVFSEEQGSFLVGAAAAGTVDGIKLALVGKTEDLIATRVGEDGAIPLHEVM